MCVRAGDKICKIFCVIKHQKYGTKNNGMTADWLPTRLPNPNSPANFIYNTQTIEKGLLVDSQGRITHRIAALILPNSTDITM